MLFCYFSLHKKYHGNISCFRHGTVVISWYSKFIQFHDTCQITQNYHATNMVFEHILSKAVGPWYYYFGHGSVAIPCLIISMYVPRYSLRYNFSTMVYECGNHSVTYYYHVPKTTMVLTWFWTCTMVIHNRCCVCYCLCFFNAFYSTLGSWGSRNVLYK